MSSLECPTICLPTPAGISELTNREFPAFLTRGVVDSQDEWPAIALVGLWDRSQLHPRCVSTLGNKQSLSQTAEEGMAGAFRQIALLVSQMREWAKTHKVKNTELAGMLGITPQGITEIFKGRNQPTGDRFL
jgi:hypothetical protein